MDTMKRNQIFLENEDLIKRVIRCNRTLIYALRLDEDDVYQELAIAMLRAISGYDPARSDCIRAHLWMKLQYAVLEIKRQHHPCGITALDGSRPHVEYADEFACPLAVSSIEKEEGASRLRRALARLEPREREVVILYLDGTHPRKKAQRAAFDSAKIKLREFYLALQFAAGLAL